MMGDGAHMVFDLSKYAIALVFTIYSFKDIVYHS